MAIYSGWRVGIEFLEVSALQAMGDARPGILMGFAAYTFQEIEIAVKKLANALSAVCMA
ncbi:hypothetical protein [Brucella gallinifaecis]|uniref:hypothetical protein n=1 Tax=Brucella gallinifaecis TaxID=215590 RepID=UPI00235E2847|nr:hypothetical protein [Brucella gallinifaecis]